MIRTYTQYLFSLLTFRNARKTLTEQRMPHIILLCQKRNHTQTLKNDSSKDLFIRCVCCWHNLLRWTFLITCDSREILLFIIICRYLEIVLTAILLLSLKPVFRRKYDTNTKVQKYSWLCFLNFWLHFS